MLRESGIDRVDLRLDGPNLRRHDFDTLRGAGFTAVGIELPYGAGPAWERLLERVLALQPDHLVFYAPAGIAPVELLQSMRTARHAVGAALACYLLHHYAVPGHPSRLMAALAGAADVAGFGPGALTCVDGRCCRNATGPDDYLAEAADGSAGYETVGMADRLLGRLVRLEGIPRADLDRQEARRLVDCGLLETRGDRLFLADQGIVALDRVRAGLARAAT